MPSATKSKIYFFFQTPVNLVDRTRLKNFIRLLFQREKKKLSSLNYIFCTDAQLLEINQQYLKHNYYTDIITFELSPRDQPVDGEVYISIDRVRDNASELDQTFKRELHRVIFHGALHLCGYKDKTLKEKKRMRVLEEVYLKKYLG